MIAAGVQPMEERANGDGDDTTPVDDGLAAMRLQYSRVNFSAVTQNFPAVEYASEQRAGEQRMGDRTTLFDGPGEVRVQTVVGAGGTRPHLNIAIVGVKKRIENFEDQQRYVSRGTVGRERRNRISKRLGRGSAAGEVTVG